MATKIFVDSEWGKRLKMHAIEHKKARQRHSYCPCEGMMSSCSTPMESNPCFYQELSTSTAPATP